MPGTITAKRLQNSGTQLKHPLTHDRHCWPMPGRTVWIQYLSFSVTKAASTYSCACYSSPTESGNGIKRLYYTSYQSYSELSPNLWLFKLKMSKLKKRTLVLLCLAWPNQLKVSLFLLCADLWGKAMKYKYLHKAKLVALWTMKSVLLRFPSPYHKKNIYPISLLHLHRQETMVLWFGKSYSGSWGSAGFAAGEVMLISLAFFLLYTSFFELYLSSKFHQT